LVLGVGASVALHAVVGWWLARAPQPTPLPIAGGETVEVQVVAVAAAPSATPAAPTARARPAAARAGAPVTVSVEVGPAPSVEMSSTEEGGGGELSPGPVAESGSLPSTELLMARLSAAALRCYPPEAVRFRLAGEAHLSFCLGVDGQASAVKIARSSGSEVLDRAAAECVLPGALPLPGAAGCYELPVRFAARSP